MWHFNLWLQQIKHVCAQLLPNFRKEMNYDCGGKKWQIKCIKSYAKNTECRHTINRTRIGGAGSHFKRLCHSIVWVSHPVLFSQRLPASQQSRQPKLCCNYTGGDAHAMQRHNTINTFEHMSHIILTLSWKEEKWYFSSFSETTEAGNQKYGIYGIYGISTKIL